MMGSIAWLRGPDLEYRKASSDGALTDIRPARQDEIPDRPGVLPRRSSNGDPIPT
jgi:hypothetical protein